ncbi:MAG TPA: ComEC/Rec2 family competence protein, partial [Saprospiraceae bacterium]|nr:ComEC/Rec2 family competence protein [Saprospiraceae bacterium]
VSVSVQILMAPLIIYYFGFYTTWFFLNTLVSIPMVYIGIFGGLLLSLSSFVSLYMTMFIGKMVALLMGWCYDGLALLNSLPFGLINNISWTILDLFLVYLFIGFLYIFIKSKDAIHFKWSILFILFLIISLSFTSFRNATSSEVIFYSVSRGYMIDIFDGKQLYALKTDDLDAVSEEYSCNAYRRSKRALDPKYITIDTVSQVNNLLVGLNAFAFKSKCFVKMLPKDQRDLNKADVVIVDGSLSKSDLDLLKEYKGNVLLLNEVKYSVRQAIDKIESKNYTLIDLAKVGSYKIKV